MSTSAYTMLAASVCLALTACGASVEVEPNDAGPLQARG
jgi:outer membrane biogenesis lipoprotein LolB